MKPFAATIVFFALIATFISAQEISGSKVDPVKTNEKSPETKKAIARVAESTVLQAQQAIAKVKDVQGADGERELIVMLVDPAKNQALVEWNQTEQFNILKSKKIDPQRIERHKQEMAKRMNNVFAAETKTVKVPESARIRTEFVPMLFDATGTPRKVTAADLGKLKAGMLPGYAADFSALKPGQIVRVYAAKPAAVTAKKSAPMPPAEKKELIGADPTLNVPAAAGPNRIDALMIYIISEPK